MVSQLHLFKQGSSVIAEGNLDPKSRHVVEVSPEILGAGGYGIAKQETWGATCRFEDGWRDPLSGPAKSAERLVLGLTSLFIMSTPRPRIRTWPLCRLKNGRWFLRSKLHSRFERLRKSASTYRSSNFAPEVYRYRNLDQYELIENASG